MATRVFKLLTLVFLFFAMSCGEPRESERNKDVPRPAVPDTLPSKPVTAGEKPTSEEILRLESFFSKIIQLDTLNLWLIKDAGQNEFPYIHASGSALVNATEAIKSNCEIMAPVEKLENVPVGRGSNMNDRSSRTVSQIDSIITGAKCPVHSSFAAKGRHSKVVKFTAQEFTYDVEISRTILNPELAGLVGFSKDVFEGEMRTVTLEEKSQTKKSTEMAGTVTVQQTDNLVVNYGVLEEKIETRSKIKVISKQVRAQYTFNFSKPFVVTFETRGTIGNATGTVTVNGHRLTIEQAPILFRAADRLILK